MNLTPELWKRWKQGIADGVALIVERNEFGISWYWFPIERCEEAGTVSFEGEKLTRYRRKF